MATWASVKKQAHDLLGIQLVDMDVLNIPMLATDPYGEFIPGTERAAAVRHQERAEAARLDDPATPPSTRPRRCRRTSGTSTRRS